MPQIGLPIPTRGMDNDQLAEYISKIVKDIEWLLGGAIDSKNIRNIAGFNVGNYDLKHISGLVGLSGYDAANPLAVRLWAGNADKSIAPFRVLQNGYMYSTRGFIGGWDIGATKLSGTGTIEGGTIIGAEIMTALAGVYPRSAMSTIDNLFIAELSADESIQMSAHFLGGVALLLNSATVSGFVGPVGSSLQITTSGGYGDVLIRSGEDLLLLSEGQTKTDSWSKFYSIDDTQTLQQALNAKQDDITTGDITIIGGTATLNSGIPATKIAGGTVNNTEFQTLNGVTSSIQSQLNDKWGDSTTSTRSAFFAYQSTLQSLSGGSNTKVLFQTEDYDQLNEFASSTFTASAVGVYNISTSVRMSNTSGNVVALSIYKNGSQYAAFPANYTGDASGSINIKLSAADTVEIYAYSQSTINTDVFLRSSYFSIVRVA